MYTRVTMRRGGAGAGVGVAVVVAYVAAALLGFRMAFVAEQVTTVWAPSGIAIAALLLRGVRLWPAVWAGAFLANATTAAPLWTAFSIATGNTLEAVVAAWALSGRPGFDPALRRTRDVLAFILVAAVGSTAIAATVGGASLCAAGVQPWSRFWPVWADWMLGDALGALVVAPAILTTARLTPDLPRRQILETAGIVLVTAAVTAIVFGELFAPPISTHPLEFVVFPLVTAAAVRVGQPATSLVVALVSAISIWNTIQGGGPFAAESVHRSLIFLQVFMGVLSGSGLVLAAAIAERRTAEQRRAAAYAVGQVLTDAMSLDEAAPRILEAVCTRLEWQVGALWTLEPLQQTLRCHSVWTRADDVVPFTQATREIEFAPGVGLPGRVWSSGGPAWIVDVTSDANFPRAPAARLAHLRGGFAFPILLAGRVLGVVEFFHRRATAPDADLLATMAAVGGQIGQFIARTHAERAMRRSESRTRAVLETALDAVITMDHRGVILDFNAAAERTFGHGRGSAIGRELAELIIPASLRERHRQGLAHFLATGRGPFIDRRVETTAVHADGREFPVEVSITAVPGEGPPLFTGFVRDVRERVAGERERQRLLERERDARRHAEEANRAKDEFLATLSHELRTPLNAIVGWTRMLLDGAVEPGQVKRTLEVIDRNAQAQVHLVSDLLDVSRIITGGLRLDRRPVDLESIVGAALDAIRPAAEARQIVLRSTLPPAGLVTVGDPARLQQIVWNLLSNAVKFTPPGGRVDIDLSDSDGRIRLQVRDTGMGIAREFLPHVFERFRQADGSAARLHGGLGLGLAIVRHLVELHGGEVRAESGGEDRGATFTVELPCIAGGETPPGAGAAEPAPAPGDPALRLRLAGCRALVVDDEEDARVLVETLLAGCGAEVRAAQSVPEALQRVQDWWPDILIADLGMPGEDGYALIGRLRAMEAEGRSRLAAAALTAYGRKEDGVRALDAGFDLHLAKPATPAVIVDAAVALWQQGRAAGTAADR